MGNLSEKKVSCTTKEQIKCAWCKEVNPPYRKLKEGGYVCDNCYKIIEDHQKQHDKLLVKESREKSQQGKEGE